jgi:hypothetical protein
MTANQRDKQGTGPKKQEVANLDALIGRYVLRDLGQPGCPHRIEVRCLWEEHYRVNVLVEVGTASVRVAHSYFLVTDENGTILISSPRITKQY